MRWKKVRAMIDHIADDAAAARGYWICPPVKLLSMTMALACCRGAAENLEDAADVRLSVGCLMMA